MDPTFHVNTIHPDFVDHMVETKYLIQSNEGYGTQYAFYSEASPDHFYRISPWAHCKEYINDYYYYADDYLNIDLNSDFIKFEDNIYGIPFNLASQIGHTMITSKTWLAMSHRYRNRIVNLVENFEAFYASCKYFFGDKFINKALVLRDRAEKSRPTHPGYKMKVAMFEYNQGMDMIHLGLLVELLRFSLDNEVYSFSSSYITDTTTCLLGEDTKDLDLVRILEEGEPCFDDRYSVHDNGWQQIVYLATGKDY